LGCRAGRTWPTGRLTLADAVNDGGNAPRSEAAFARLEELIVLAELKPGILYSEKELAALVGYGRTPVREALQRLEIEGLVTIRERKGIQIAEVDVDTQLHLLEIRRPLQDFCAECGALRATEENRAAMRGFAGTLRAMATRPPETRTEILSAVRTAHDLVIGACHNEFASKTMRIVQGLSRRFWLFHLTRDGVAPALTLHATLLDCVAEGDAEAAVAASGALAAHLEDYARRCRSW